MNAGEFDSQVLYPFKHTVFLLLENLYRIISRFVYM